MNTAYAPSPRDQEAMADYIVESVIGDATGTARGDRFVGEPPSARYYLSALAPTNADFSAGPVRRGRVVPTSAVFEFEVEDGCVLDLQTGCRVYYRVFPSYEGQLEQSDQTASPDARRGRKYRLVRVFVRRQIDVGDLGVAIDP